MSKRQNQREYRLVLEGLGRFALTKVVQVDPFFLAVGTPLEEVIPEGSESRLLAQALREHVEEIATGSGGALSPVAASESEPGVVADQIAAGLGLTTDKEVELLSTLDVLARLRLVSTLLAEAKALSDVKKKLDSDVRRELGKSQRDVLLREQLRALQRELGDEKGGDDLAILREKLDKADLSTEARTTADKELRRLEAMPPQGMEHNVIRTYLEWIADLPWNTRAAVKDDLTEVQKKLDEDHFGLTDVKKRILEHMAVLKLSGNRRGSILCFAGPPGVGKTSLGQSIADATGRPFVRISLGGVRDEAEVRGHRRTYVGALPGRIIHALKKAKAKNAIVLLDEIDKLGSGWAGSP